MTNSATHWTQRILAGEKFVPLPVTAWESERVRLAGAPEVPLADWDTVRAAYDKVHGFNWRYQAELLDDQGVPPGAVSGIRATHNLDA